MTTLTTVNLKEFSVVGLTRPMRMLLEPLVFSTNLFLAYQYAIQFLYFEAYPIIFKCKFGTCLVPAMIDTALADIKCLGTYAMNPGVAACILLPSKVPLQSSPNRSAAYTT